MSDLKYFEVKGIELHNAKVIMGEDVHGVTKGYEYEPFTEDQYKIMVAIDSIGMLHIHVDVVVDLKEEKCEYKFDTIYNGSYSIYPKGD